MASVKQSLSRINTNRLLDAITEGAIDKDIVISACLQYMSEAEVTAMMASNDFLTEDDEDNADE